MINLGQFDLAEYEQSLIQFLGIKYRHVFLDVAFLLEPFLSLKHRGGCQMYCISQFFGGQLCISLQCLQNLKIGFV